MTTEKNATERQPFVMHDKTNDVMALNRKSEEPLPDRILSQSARAAARAYDEVFTLKHKLALALQPERDRIAPEVQALQEQIFDLTLQLEAARPALTKQLIQNEGIVQKDRADALQKYNEEILASTSWRITAPLRRLSLVLRRVKNVAPR